MAYNVPPTEPGCKLESSNLKKAGLKVTLPRVRILELLEQDDQQHVTAEEIYRSLTDAGVELGLATVYRVLTQFETAGLVRRHHFEGGQAVFELDRGAHHDHILCVDCGEVVEFLDEIIEERQRAVAKRFGFEIEDHSLTLYGRCARTDCPRR